MSGRVLIVDDDPADVQLLSNYLAGIVDEVRVDEATGELRSVIVRKAGVLGGGAVREIPADHLEVAERELHVIEEAPGTHVR